MKLILDNRTNLNWIEVLPYVEAVIKQGRISETGKGTQFAFDTIFDCGDKPITIYAEKNEHSDKLIITQ